MGWQYLLTEVAKVYTLVHIQPLCQWDYSPNSPLALADTMEEIGNATLLGNSSNKRKHNTVFLPTNSNIIVKAQNTGQQLVATILTKVIDYRILPSVQLQTSLSC